MNKKLLGLGATFLPMVPLVVAVVSCSSTAKVTIDTEAKKFEISVETIEKDIMASEAVNSINNAIDDEGKLNALKELVGTLPTLDKEFGFRVKSAEVNSIYTVMDVTIRVFEIKNEKNAKDANYRIRDFQTYLDREAKKFETSVETKNKNISPNDAVDSINLATNFSAKRAALENLAVIPTLREGFDFIVGSAVVNVLKTTINVSIQVFEVNTTNVKTVFYLITDFQIPSALDIEAKRFEIKLTTLQAETSRNDAINMLNTASNQKDKLDILKLLVGENNIPISSKGFSFEIHEALIIPTSDSSIYVTIKVIELVNTTNSKDVFLTIRGLTPSPSI
ncbi:MAG: hypothetical protein ACRCWU_02300 [Metamycoplasmataceae bacterium]